MPTAAGYYGELITRDTVWVTVGAGAHALASAGVQVSTTSVGTAAAGAVSSGPDPSWQAQLLPTRPPVAVHVQRQHGILSARPEAPRAVEHAVAVHVHVPRRVQPAVDVGPWPLQRRSPSSQSAKLAS